MNEKFKVGSLLWIREAYTVGKFPSATFGGVRLLKGTITGTSEDSVYFDIVEDTPIYEISAGNHRPLPIGYQTKRTINNVFRDIAVIEF